MSSPTASLSIIIEETTYSLSEVQTPVPVLEEVLCDGEKDHVLTAIVAILIGFMILSLLANPWFGIGSAVMILAILARISAYPFDATLRGSIIVVSLYGDRASL